MAQTAPHPVPEAPCVCTSCVPTSLPPSLLQSYSPCAPCTPNTPSLLCQTPVLCVLCVPVPPPCTHTLCQSLSYPQAVRFPKSSATCRQALSALSTLHLLLHQVAGWVFQLPIGTPMCACPQHYSIKVSAGLPSLRLSLCICNLHAQSTISPILDNFPGQGLQSPALMLSFRTTTCK